MPRHLRLLPLGSLLLATTLGVAAPPSANPVDTELLAELVARYERDQFIRSQFSGGVLPIEHHAIAAALTIQLVGTAIDRENTAWLEGIVAERGWPSTQLVGQRGAHCAWLLVQHADLRPDFQERCLELMRAASDESVAPQELAYLEDRIAVGQGKPQRYGTQLHMQEGRLAPQPLADPQRVDTLRAEVGLPPLEEYLRMANAFFLHEANGQP
ncbi:DUF6624 domain-containing protein [Botrimarina hoheduenensis]|uniref:Uncharacterized protein n=1 Tax=Botrimarina hoheduenensis TaxID=2528000 RepID=A0A5C5WC97_9BACT|nr:DUF6624 domain-containing protein [Botrimarina hoheduenensis]TWT47292.1 hypothetical protein Pla111_09050 [Botrimarina hoheduenensis]